MSSERLYYTDAYLVEFDAVVREVQPQGRPLEGRRSTARRSTPRPAASRSIPALSAKPTSSMCSSRKTARIGHLVDRELEKNSRVRGHVDWSRRFDHMQQHTGQHLLSAAFEREAGAKTVSFHLGTSASTIDLDKELSADQIARVEDAANSVLWEDREVCVKFVTASEAAKLPLRKDPAREGRAAHRRNQGLRSFGVRRHARESHWGDRRHCDRRLRAVQRRPARGIRVRRPRVRAYPRPEELGQRKRPAAVGAA